MPFCGQILVDHARVERRRTTDPIRRCARVGQCGSFSTSLSARSVSLESDLVCCVLLEQRAVTYVPVHGRT